MLLYLSCSVLHYQLVVLFPSKLNFSTKISLVSLYPISNSNIILILDLIKILENIVPFLKVRQKRDFRSVLELVALLKEEQVGRECYVFWKYEYD